jgi:hypothetical protein
MSDPELDAMATVFAALEPLDDPARGRVLKWAAAKFEISSSAQAGGAALAADLDVDGGSHQFDDMADLVHAAQPSNGPERALVVGYWFQELQGNDGWTGGDINSSLKNMGSGLANVTKTLDSLKARKPALVMQTSKSGRSRQARKTYKLTVAGVQAVKAMLVSASQEVA